MEYEGQTVRVLGIRLIIACIALGSGPGAVLAQSKADSLKNGFENPPESARPLVWWHWMNGNISKKGIELDLEWMHKVGLGGFQVFDAGLATPQVVDHRIAYMTPEWKDAFKYATTLADQLGLEEAIAGSPGWSESGGPWVPASEGMKKYVWSETFVSGGKPFTGMLAHPPSNTGPFQGKNIHGALDASQGAAPNPQFYADSVVIAYRKVESDVPIESLHPKITASVASVNIAMLSDGDLNTTTKLPVPYSGESGWIQYEFAQPQTIRSITLATVDPQGSAALLAGIYPPEKTLEISDDGIDFRTAVHLSSFGAPEYTISFPAVTAKYFRVVFKRVPPPPISDFALRLDPATIGVNMGTPPTDYDIAELVLHSGMRVNMFEQKAAFGIKPDLYSFATPAVDREEAIAHSDVIDLTAKMSHDGRLDWTPPPGDWVILRFGYSLLGITNHPASPEATGLEVDKLDHRFVRHYMDTYLDNYKEAVGHELIGKRGIRYVVNDSWEAGSQNWTDNMIDNFKRLRGYDPLPWMPVLTGQVVDSSEASDHFLWDFRRTISDLIADEHYGQLEATLHERGMGHYGESHESGRVFVGDGMEVKKYNEVPMSAMWTQRLGVNNELFSCNADDRESASVAHVYGQNLAAAESMTAGAAPWAWSPATLKPTADQEFLNGINRIVIHESTHQPLEDKAPGLTLGPFGQWFNRNETWAASAAPWISYLARSSYLLQQGTFNADLIYFYGEDSNLTAIFSSKAPDVPAGYGFDYINADGLIHMLSASSGNITTQSGMRYRLLALDPYGQHMSLPVLRAIHKLVEDGAVIAGFKPNDDPSLADDQAQFHQLSDELFGDGTGVHLVGKGKVYAGQDVGAVFTALQIAPDFDYSKPESDSRLLFVHRKLADADIYFVDNRNDRNEEVEATFRIEGRIPELWYADSGRTEPVSFSIANGRTAVPLRLEPWGTVFVVFRKATKETSRTLREVTETQLATVTGPWKVNFQPNRGAPPSISLDRLASWSDNQDAGVKYFSGTGTYTHIIDVMPHWFENGAHVWIDLGDVKNLAEVTVNGKSLGTVWHTPYRVDATAALKPGKNELSIQVTNAWVNRLIGDQQPDASRQYTFTTVKPYHADSPLLSSGLLGPVRLYSIATK